MVTRICVFILFLTNSLNLFSQGWNCETATLLSDSVSLIPAKDLKEAWFKFQPEKKDLLLKVLTNRSKPSDYFLYQSIGDAFCDSLAGNRILPVRARVCNTDSSFDKIILTEEQIDGVCNCEVCELKDRPLHLNVNNVYFLKVMNFKDTIVIDMDYDWMEEEDAKKDASKSVFDVEIKEGQLIKLNKILFMPESPVLMPESRKELKNLLLFLTANPTVKIEIQGHVNAPGASNIPKDQKLSEMRAKAVYDYLIQNKISADRLKYVGYGNTKPIIAFPKSELEQQKNRRVEILITGK